MKNALILLALAVVAGPLYAQETLEEKLDKKLKSPFLARAAWFTDYDKAREAAKKDGKLILGFFTRSYAPCGPCANVEKNLLDTDDFAAWSKGFVLLCHITSKVEGAKHQGLLQEKGGKGFPYLVFMDAEGKVLAAHKAERNLEKLAETARQAKDATGAKKTKSGFDVFAADLEDGAVESWEAAQERLKGLGELTKEQKAKVAPALHVLEAQAALKDARRQNPETIVKAGKTCSAMLKGGRIPTANKPVLVSFWLSIVEFQQAEKNVAAFEEAIDGLDDCIGDKEGARTFIADKRKLLTDMKAAAKKPAPPAPEKTY